MPGPHWLHPLLFLHALASVAMAGLIWFVQIVHYPLFARVGPESFTAYEAEHQRRTTLVVGPLMLAEMIAAALLALAAPSLPSPALAYAGLGLVVFLWAHTFLLAIPIHEKLSRNFDATLARRLVLLNWPRTIAWSARAVIALAMLAQGVAP